MKAHRLARLLLKQPNVEVVFEGGGDYNFLPTGEILVTKVWADDNSGSPVVVVMTTEDDRPVGEDQEDEDDG